jgi:hypothetical protein
MVSWHRPEVTPSILHFGRLRLPTRTSATIAFRATCARLFQAGTAGPLLNTAIVPNWGGRVGGWPRMIRVVRLWRMGRSKVAQGVRRP